MDISLPIHLMDIIVYHFQPRKIKSSFNSQSETYFLSFSFPFEWRSPFGYIAAEIIQSIGIYVVAMIFYFVFFVTIAHCVFLIAFCLDRDNELLMLDEIIKTRIVNKKKKLSTHKFCLEVKKQLCKFIRFQCETKQLSG